MRVEVTLSTGEVLIWTHVARIVKITEHYLSLRYMCNGKEKDFHYNFHFENTGIDDDFIMDVHVTPGFEVDPEYNHAQPIIDAEPIRSGKWIEHKDYPGLAYLCSECGRFTTERSHYCPDCGAKMEEVTK